MQLRHVHIPGGIDVKLIDQYPLYELGGVLHELKEISSRDGVKGFDQLVALFAADAQIRVLLGGQPVEISYSRDAALQVVRLINAATSEFRDKETGGWKSEVPVLAAWQMSSLKSAIEVLEHQFSAELKKMAIYAVPRRGIFDTEKLVASAEGHIPESVRADLPPFVVSEFRAAGRCLAFGLFSASGFHALRAAECALEQYYIAFLGVPQKEDITMGLMRSHLQDRIDSKDAKLPKPSTATLRTIADITSFDRNPLTHKELDLTEDDAAMLFNRAQGMIALMAREIKDRAEELQPPLPLLEAPPIGAFGAAAEDLGLVPTKSKKKGKPTTS
jgi:hypothetical protein